MFLYLLLLQLLDCMKEGRTGIKGCVSKVQNCEQVGALKFLEDRWRGVSLL